MVVGCLFGVAAVIEKAIADLWVEVQMDIATKE